MSISEQIKKLKENSKKRNFNQTYDLIINLKDLDLKKSENKINEIVVLPVNPGKEKTITVFTESDKKIKGTNLIKKSKIESLGKNKKELSKLISETGFFFAEPKLMPVVGRHLGKYLAPKGLMPKVLTGSIKETAEKYKDAVNIRIEKQPIIHTIVGTQDMKEKDIEKNIETILDFLKTKLPKGRNNIKNVYLKFTMSKPVKLGI